MKFIIISNNPLVRAEYDGQYEVLFVEGTYHDVLTTTRDKCHAGHALLSHPLSGSVKPNETLYKSIMVSKDAGAVDADSITLIEEAVFTAEKFGSVRRNWRQREIEDFRLIDLTLISSAVESAANSLSQ